MNKMLAGAALLLLPIATGALAADSYVPPPWAYPVMDPGFTLPDDGGRTYQAEGSTKSFTRAQIDDPFNPPDWYPNEHPKMPQVVEHGRKPDARACAQCHMPHGAGHPESASMAGLTAKYITEQMAAFKSGERKSLIPARSATMLTIAKAITDDEIKAAAEYFAQLKPVKWMRIVESATVPKTYVGQGNMRHAATGPAAGSEPLGMRIIELPEDSAKAQLRDSHSTFMAYVPPGSIAKGKALVGNGGNGKTIQCGICHGPELKGLGDVPALAGRSPIYVIRQLDDMQHGSRTGPDVELMKAVVAKLSEEDMVDIAAYTASLAP